MSWNIEWFGYNKYKSGENNFINTDYNKIIDNIYSVKLEINKLNPDIVCLQEVANYGSIYKLVEFLPEYKIFLKQNIKKTLFQINVFLVKKTVKVKNFYIINNNPKFIHLQYYFNNKIYNLINLHLKSDYSKENSQKRFEQITEILNYIKQKNIKNIILTGDFNSELGSKELNLLNNFINILISRKMKKQEINYSLWWDKNKTNEIDKNELKLIDYFFTDYNTFINVKGCFINKLLSSNLIKITNNNSKISDHNPIILIF